MSMLERSLANYVESRRQLARSGLSRREVARMGLLATSSGVLIGAGGRARSALAAEAVVQSPATTPWVERMPVPPVLQPCGEAAYDPPANGPAHQYWQAYRPQKYYKMSLTPATCRWAPEIAQDANNWCYEGIFPGPTIDARYGEPFCLRIANDLPDSATYRGWGYPGSITHLHNFHTASESDGGPWRYTLRGEYTDHHYCMQRAGFTTPERIPAAYWAGDEGGGDKRETLTSLFYHQHMPEYTAANVYKGLVGFCRLFDDKDTGDETRGYRLPSGDYDIPLVLADKSFDADGQLYFDPFLTDGFLGDKLTVNGKIQPYFEVDRRKYRFRFLNGGPSRFYTVVFRLGAANLPMRQVTDNGNFLEAPKTISKLEIWPAERTDVVIDFAAYPDGTEIYLANTMLMRSDGRGPNRSTTLNPDYPRNRLVKFIVRGARPADDPSEVPAVFRPYPPIIMSEVVRTRIWNFERKNGAWAVNGRLWDPEADHVADRLLQPVNQVKRNTAEVWVLNNPGGSWEHPLHIHFEEGRVLRRNGVSIPAARSPRLDVYRLTASTKLEVFLRFRDYPDPAFTYSTGMRDGDRADAGRYVMHCHNMVHEDHAMMTSWSIVP